MRKNGSFMSDQHKPSNGEEKNHSTVSEPAVPAAEEFSLESILAEFGRGAAEPAQNEETTRTPEDVKPLEPAADEPKKTRAREEKPLPKKKKVLRFPGRFRGEAEEPDAIRTAEQDISSPLGHRPEENPEEMPRVPLEDVMYQTVESALEEQEDALLEEPVSLGERLLSWRDKLLSIIEDIRRRKKRTSWQDTEEEEEKSDEPETDLEFAAREEKRLCRRLRRQMILSALPLAVLTVLTVAEAWKIEILPQIWRENVPLRCGVMGGGLLLTAFFSVEVWRRGWRTLRRRKVGCEAAAALAVLAVLGDCIYRALTGGAPQLPLAAPCAALVWLCLLGQYLTASMERDIYRLADLGGCPPYAAAVTAAGLCKQRGRIRGFYRTSRKEDLSRRWQYHLVPLAVAVCTILSAVVCLSGGRGGDFFRVWSAMLMASLPFSLPLAGALPLRNLNRRLGRSGCAVAGYEGAAWVGEGRRIVVTDDDIFPPGTVSLNGLKLYGEEIGRAASYAATVSRAARSQLAPVFDQLLTAEGGRYEEVQDIHYYEEGGVECTIHGETVTMGSAYCMKKLHIALPRELKVKTGVFLAVDGQLTAIFAIRYQPSRNVEWALRALRRSRIEPVLAVCGANITPGLLKRKFRVDAKPVYPDISTRLALADLGREKAHRACAIIYREGLMPFAETVMGSRRCRRAVRSGTVLCWLGSLCGMILSYYLTHVAAFGALTGGALLLFQLLWLLPVWLLAGLIRIE